MNKDNFSKNTAILVILGCIILVIISSYLAIGEITKFKNVKGILQIIISIVGLFATFGGAYLGAKISGENARENMNTQLESQKEENKRNEFFNRKRLSIEMKNNTLNDYLIQLNELDNMLQKMEVEIKSYLLFTQNFGERYKEISDDEYFYFGKKRVDDFNKIVTKHLEIEKQRNRVKMSREIAFKNDGEIPNIVMDMLEPVVNIEVSKISRILFKKINSFLIYPNDIYSGISDYLKFYQWIDEEKKQVINTIKKNLNSLNEYKLD